jgi:hypothetical protein
MDCTYRRDLQVTPVIANQASVFFREENTLKQLIINWLYNHIFDLKINNIILYNYVTNLINLLSFYAQRNTFFSLSYYSSTC